MGILVMYPGPSRVKKAISFETLENVTFMKILVATEKPFAKAAVDGIREIVEGAGYELALLEKYADKAELLAAVADADGLIVRSDKVTREVIDAARNLKIVVRAGAGYDNVDLAACTERGIVVMNTPGQNSNAVAELVVSMMIFISRNQFTPGTGAEVSGKRLGIHAYGNVGRIVARYARHEREGVRSVRRSEAAGSRRRRGGRNGRGVVCLVRLRFAAHSGYGPDAGIDRLRIAVEYAQVRRTDQYRA